MNQKYLSLMKLLNVIGNNSRKMETLDWNYNFLFYDVLDELISEEIKNL